MSDCSCSTCQSACLHKPGWFLPEEIKPLAEFLGMTEKEVFDNHLMVDYAVVVDHDVPEDFDHNLIYVLSPKIVGKKGGTEFPFDPGGKCHWFVDGKCSIHPVKPYECRQYDHTKTQKQSEQVHATDIPNRWVAHQQMITDLLGHEPDVDSGAGRFGFMMDLLSGPGSFSKNSQLLASDYLVQQEDLCIVIDMHQASYEEVVSAVHKMLGKRLFVTEVSGANLGMSFSSSDLTISDTKVSFLGWVAESVVESETGQKTVLASTRVKVDVITSFGVGNQFARKIIDQTPLETEEDIPLPTVKNAVLYAQQLQGSSAIFPV